MLPQTMSAIAALAALAAVATTAQAAPRQDQPPRPVPIATGPAPPPAPILNAPPQKVCQAIGDVDWATGAPTADRTLTRFGLDAADLGFPVEHKGKLILLFGDSWPPPHGGGAKGGGSGEIPPDDSVAVTSRKAAPGAGGGCLDLTVNHSPGPPPVFAPSTITTTPAVRQGFFNVPTSGVTVAGVLYAAFWTDHCMSPGKLDPLAATPLTLPAATTDCPENARRNSLGRAVLASSADEGRTFAKLADMPIGFNYPAFTPQSADSRSAGGADMGPGVFVFASPRYRAGVPYLAFAPAKTFADPTTWRYFAGLQRSGAPTWVDYAAWTGSAAPASWTPPAGAEVFTPASAAAGRCVGELSVTWIDQMQQWLMLYNCGVGGILARVAEAPWGPWSAPTLVLSAASSGAACTLVMDAAGCPGGPAGSHRDYWPGRRKAGAFVRGGFYAPYVLSRYTTDAEVGGSHAAIIYWMVSPWNPYETTVISMALHLTEDIPPPPPPPPPPPGRPPAPQPPYRAY